MVDESLNKQEIALYDYSQYKELKSIYANNITVSHICEKLSYFNINDSAIDAKTYMEENNYDYLGIEENGIIMGYINRSSLGNGIGKCKDYLIEFNSLNLISDSTPIIDLISILRDTPAIFVLVRNKVKNIVTRADLQKPPVRMLIFGYINILEMNLLQTINYFYKEDTWTDYISQNRLEKARTLYQERKARNEAKKVDFKSVY